MSRGILVVIIRRLLCLENKSNLHLCIIVVLSEIKVPQKDIFLFRKKIGPETKICIVACSKFYVKYNLYCNMK